MTALTLVLGLAGLAWVWRRQPGRRRTVAAVLATGGLSFQAVHVVEHAAQFGAWAAAPARPPWLTPWAAVGRDLLAVGGDAVLGTELLHLLGNVVFLVGLVALAWLAQGTSARRPALLALWLQGAHVVEHVALTVGVVVSGTAVGVTTGFGLLAPGPALWTTRVLAHFAINAAATVVAGRAAWVMLRLPAGSAPGPVRRPGRVPSSA